MKCAGCGREIVRSEGMAITVLGNELHTVNWCTWCCRQILTVPIFRRVRDKAIADGWVQEWFAR